MNQINALENIDKCKMLLLTTTEDDMILFTASSTAYSEEYTATGR